METAIEVRPMDPNDPAARALVEATDSYQKGLYPPESLHLDSVEELSGDHVRFLGASMDGAWVGCAAVKLIGSEYGEMKRLFVLPSARGRGVAQALMAARERLLTDAGIHCARLETGIHQTNALRFFEAMGYRRIGPFGPYNPDPLSVFLEKRLEAPGP